MVLTFVMGQNRLAIVPIWEFHRSDVGEMDVLTKTGSIVVLFGRMRAHSDRLSKPLSMLTPALNGGNLCHGSKSFCNRSAVGISSFRYGEIWFFDYTNSIFGPIQVKDGAFETSQ